MPESIVQVKARSDNFIGGTNCYHMYPAHAAFGGYKISGVGRENHRMMLDHYSQTKCLLVSYDSKPLGLFYTGPGVHPWTTLPTRPTTRQSPQPMPRSR